MKLARISNLLTWLVAGLLVSACVSVWLAFELNGRYRAEVEQLHRAGDAINHLQLLAHQRSMAVRSYVSTTEEFYYRDYQALRESANDFDQVVQSFVIQRMPESYVMQLLAARDKSTQMGEYELQAFALARAGDWKQAIEKVFGQEYQQASLAVQAPLQAIEQALHEQGRAQVNQVERNARTAMYVAVLLTLGGCCWWLWRYAASTTAGSSSRWSR